MEEEILVNIEYAGFLAAAAGKNQEKILVPGEIKQAIQQIQHYIGNSYGIDKNYTILINKKRVSEFTNNYLQNESAIITIIPVLSGG